MNKDVCIVVTGAAGFIGSCMTSYLNQHGYSNLVLVDDFSHESKAVNLRDKKIQQKIPREEFFKWLEKAPHKIDFIFHLGARTDTTEFDYSIHEHLNLNYSKKIWEYCTHNQIPLVYASSAATYGDGKLGYKDDHDLVDVLEPLNPYGISKNEFDKWALQNATNNFFPPFWAGLKFFNVYGPNEYHKGRMASVIFHAHRQIKLDGFVKLFRSHRSDFKDGEQLRDFIYVKDVLEVCAWLRQNYQDMNISPGLYNLGTGKARTFKDLVSATFDAMGIPDNIEYIDMPEDLQGNYQYYTEADMQKLIAEGYPHAFYSLESGVKDYLQNYLMKNMVY